MTRHRFGLLFALCGKTNRFVARSANESGDESPHSRDQQAARRAADEFLPGLLRDSPESRLGRGNKGVLANSTTSQFSTPLALRPAGQAQPLHSDLVPWLTFARWVSKT